MTETLARLHQLQTEALEREEMRLYWALQLAIDEHIGQSDRSCENSVRYWRARLS